MKKGFTLAELLCAIVILGIIVILAIPNITNIVNSEKDNISDTMKNTIFSAVDLYIQDRNETYPKTNENVYCIRIKDLVDSEYLPIHLTDPITKEDIDTDKFVKASVIGNSFRYELTDSCDETILDDMIIYGE